MGEAAIPSGRAVRSREEGVMSSPPGGLGYLLLFLKKPMGSEDFPSDTRAAQPSVGFTRTPYAALVPSLFTKCLLH